MPVGKGKGITTQVPDNWQNTISDRHTYLSAIAQS